MFIAVALIAGVAIGYFLKSDAPVQELENDKGYVVASKIADTGDSASLKALRRRIAELEREIASWKAKAEEEKTAGEKIKVEAEQAKAGKRDERRGPPSMAEMRARMEKLKEEDPQKFAEITSRMEKFRQRRLERANAKLDFLSSVDTSGMTAEQKKSHESYQDLLMKREELEEKMHNPETADADRESIMKEMHETDRAMRRAAQQERQTLIEQTTKALGFSGEDATAVSTTISEIFTSTEQGHGMPPPPQQQGPR